MNTKHIQHLYWRAGFGILPEQLKMFSKNSKAEIIDMLFYNSKTRTPLLIDTSEFDSVNEMELKKDKILKIKLIELSKERIKDFNYAWIERLINPKELLRERMTLFWANHFVCGGNNILHMQKFNNTLRKHALGDFRDFVKAISKEAAMISYLNGNQNRKRKPNENFARELMELFTLGIGNYSEGDVKQVARAFTGYNFDYKGRFQLRQKQHDYGRKTIFGKAGLFNGNNTIDIITNQQQCAQFICEKIYRYFVNDSVVPSHVKEMVSVFYPNYNIEELMRFVLNSYWFYDKKNIGVKIKSPIDLLVGIQKVVPITFKKKQRLLYIQRLFGQVLLKPPNVAGWKVGKYWVDSNTMVSRLRLASILMNEFRIPFNEKGGFTDKYRRQYFKNNADKSVFKTEPNWKTFHKNFDAFSSVTLEATLLLSPINNGTKAYLKTLNKSSKQDYCIQLMSLPEYQMC